METYTIKKSDSFELEDIFECGQCFRWNKMEDGSYIGVIKEGVVKVEEQDDNITFTGKLLDGYDFKKVIRTYFDLDTDYEIYKEKLKKIDTYMKESIEYGSGIRILNQDLWECIISFIISANNNIPRIKKIIENLSRTYGKKIVFEGRDYYTFPDEVALSKASIEDLRNMGLGFRDVRVYNTTKMIIENNVNLESIKKLDSTEDMRNILLSLDGVGPKVADCILLFSLKRWDVFPIDVWVRRVMNDLYIKKDDEKKVNKKEILELATKKYGDISGLAQQYLFYWKRGK